MTITITQHAEFWVVAQNGATTFFADEEKARRYHRGLLARQELWRAAATPRPMVCLYCAQPYEGKGRSKYCSSLCRWRAANRRKSKGGSK